MTYALVSTQIRPLFGRSVTVAESSSGRLRAGHAAPIAARRIREPPHQQPDIAIMIQLQRTLSILSSAVMLAAATAGQAMAEESTIAHAIAMHGEPKYPERNFTQGNFSHSVSQKDAMGRPGY